MRPYCWLRKILPQGRFVDRHFVGNCAPQDVSLHVTMPEEIDRPTKSAQLLPGMGWLTDTELKTLMSRAPVGEPHTSEQYHLLVAANAARAEAMRRALRPQR